MTTPTVKVVLDLLEESSMIETVDFLMRHETCPNPNAKSIQSAVTRLCQRQATLKKTKTPNGKIALEEFLTSSFTFPRFHQTKAESGR